MRRELPGGVVAAVVLLAAALVVVAGWWLTMGRSTSPPRAYPNRVELERATQAVRERAQKAGINIGQTGIAPAYAVEPDKNAKSR